MLFCSAPGSEPGLPLTSAAHRRLTNLNDPEVTMSTVVAPERRRGLLWLALSPSLNLVRTLVTAADADAVITSVQVSISCNSG